MTDNDQAGISGDSDTHNALRSLPVERPFSPAMEDRTLAAVRRGAVRRRFSLAHLAAAAAILLAGVGIGRLTPAVPAEADYVLLVHNDARAGDGAERNREYGAWAQTLARSGNLIGGEELVEQGTIIRSSETGVAPSEPASGLIGGYFLLKASSDAEAVRIARECPHLRHGGTVELRRVMRR